MFNSRVIPAPAWGQQADKDQNDIDAALAGTTQTFDLMNRPLITNFVNGGRVTMDYHGDALPLKSTKTTKITSALDLVVSSLTDGLGRTLARQAWIPILRGWITPIPTMTSLAG